MFSPQIQFLDFTEFNHFISLITQVAEFHQLFDSFSSHFNTFPSHTWLALYTEEQKTLFSTLKTPILLN